MIGILAATLITIGGIFLIAGSLGVLRCEDVYLRLQFSSKSLTFGLCFFIAGMGLLTPGELVGWKTALIILFQFLTAPIAANIIAHVAHECRIKKEKVVASADEESTQ